MNYAADGYTGSTTVTALYCGVASGGVGMGRPIANERTFSPLIVLNRFGSKVRLSLRLAESFENPLSKRVGALRGACDGVDVDALPRDNLWR